MVNLSVIIPTLNEAEHLAATLEAIAEVDCEIIIVDGGSNDATSEIAKQFAVKLLSTKTPDRPQQLNLGAASAQHDLLLFVHADTIASPLAITRLIDAFQKDPVLVGGGFYRFFDSDSRILKMTCRWANWRSRRWGIFLGDQGIFVRADIFQEMNGFREDLPFGEDLDFSIRLRNFGQTIALEPPAISSARRFDKLGPVRQTIKDFLLTLKLIRLRM